MKFNNSISFAERNREKSDQTEREREIVIDRQQQKTTIGNAKAKRRGTRKTCRTKEISRIYGFTQFWIL